MQQHQRLQDRSPLAFLILASLVDGSKRATTLHEAVIQAGGLLIEPGAFSRMVARLERRGWIVGYEGGDGWRRYQITDLGRLALQAYERSNQEQYEREKKRMMPLVLWILRLYPQGWRERYEAEMEALLAEHHITLWTILDLLLGALDARLDPYYRRERQLLPIKRYKSSWRLLVVGFVAFWFALLPWFWMSQIGLDDADCSKWSVWRGNSALCMLRKTLGAPPYSAGGVLVGLILIFLPVLLMLFMTMLVVTRGKKTVIHLKLAQAVTVGMIVLCLVCGLWLAEIWQLLPQIGRFYPQTPAGLIIGIVGMGLTTVLAQGALARAASALRKMEKAAPRQEVPVREEAATSFAEALATRKGEKWEWAALLGLVLLFIVPWPALISGNPPDPAMLLFIWVLAVVVGLITSWLVREPGKTGEQRARRKPRWATSPLWWATVLPAPSLTLFLFGIGSESRGWPLLLAGLVSAATVVIVKIRMAHPRIPGPVSRGVMVLATIFMLQGVRETVTPPFHPWPMLVLVNLVSISPAFFVRVPTRSSQVEGESWPQGTGTGAAPRVVSWVFFLLVCNAVYVHFTTYQYPLSPWAGWNEMLLSIVMVICLIPALVVKIQTGNRWAAGEREPAPNRVSPRVWMVVLPIVFLTFVTQIENIFSPDFSTFANVFISWLLTGEAALIMLLAFRLGSRKRSTTSKRESPQAHMQVQG